MPKHWSTKLEALYVCWEAVEWSRQYDSLADAWAKCQRPDWMLWLLERTLKLPDDPTTQARRDFSRVPTAFAKRALKYADPKNRPMLARHVRDLERWARADPRVTLELLDANRVSAWALVAARWAARWAAWAAGAAGEAAGTAEAAWGAAREAARAAGATERKAQARIIRKFYPTVRFPRKGK